MPPLTEYELERQANIERNKRILKELGLYDGLEVAPSRAKAEAKAEMVSRPKRESTKRKKKSPEPVRTRRKSARLALLSNGKDRSRSPDSDSASVSGIPSSDPIDFLSHSIGPSSSLVRVFKLRRISPPPPVYEVDESEEGVSDEDLNEMEERDEDDQYQGTLPIRDPDRTIRFRDAPQFTPNMTPEEIVRAGSFGGTAFRRHYSSVLKRWLPKSDYEEFPSSWFTNLEVNRYLTAKEYDERVNRYRVKAGQSLKNWEASGWVHEQDPRGWIQWYFRFYLGRRSDDDDRQIKRWIGVCGPNGRFRKTLVKKIVEKDGDWDDETISPILRQTRVFPLSADF